MCVCVSLCFALCVSLGVCFPVSPCGVAHARVRTPPCVSMSVCFTLPAFATWPCDSSPPAPTPPLSRARLGQGHKAAVPGGCLLFWLGLGTGPVTPRQCSVSLGSQCQIPVLGWQKVAPPPSLAQREQEVGKFLLTLAALEPGPSSPSRVQGMEGQLGFPSPRPPPAHPAVDTPLSRLPSLCPTTLTGLWWGFPALPEGLWAPLDVREQGGA